MVQPLNLLSQPDNKSVRAVSPSNSAIEEEEHKEPEPRVVKPIEMEDSLNPKSQRYQARESRLKKTKDFAS